MRRPGLGLRHRAAPISGQEEACENSTWLLRVPKDLGKQLRSGVRESLGE